MLDTGYTNAARLQEHPTAMHLLLALDWKGLTIERAGVWAAGFMAFVLQLQKGCYLYQFGQYAWTHLTLMFIQIPSSFFVSNIFDGIIWFLLPCGLVIINDIGAYLAGAEEC